MIPQEEQIFCSSYETNLYEYQKQEAGKLNKKKLICIAAASVLLICCAAPTIAFITRQTKTENIITFGNVRLQLHETTLNEDNQEIEFQEDTETDITHSDTCSRIVRVENLGEQPIYLRVSLSMEGTQEDGTSFQADEYASYQLNEEDWYYENGWYYYKTELAPHVTSEELMTQVIFNDISEITEKYPGSKFKLSIDAQGVQSKNNGGSVSEAAGWPEE